MPPDLLPTPTPTPTEPSPTAARCLLNSSSTNTFELHKCTQSTCNLFRSIQKMFNHRLNRLTNHSFHRLDRIKHQIITICSEIVKQGKILDAVCVCMFNHLFHLIVQLMKSANERVRETSLSKDNYDENVQQRYRIKMTCVQCVD